MLTIRGIHSCRENNPGTSSRPAFPLPGRSGQTNPRAADALPLGLEGFTQRSPGTRPANGQMPQAGRPAVVYDASNPSKGSRRDGWRQRPGS
jgi:hypothetical protein